MTQTRIDALTTRLEKGHQKTLAIFNSLTPEQWQEHLYENPTWRVQSLLVHFVSAEKQLLSLAQNVAAGGEGAPIDLDINQFNASEQIRLGGNPLQELMKLLDEERGDTIAWVKTLDDVQLDRVGRHPLLGEVSVETLVNSIYGHQLFHMKDLMRLLGSAV